jgi:transposase
VRSRTRAKNAVHAALARGRKRRPSLSDLFGRAGRAWLARLEPPAHERRIVASCLREVDFLSQQIAALEAELAGLALASEQVKRLVTVPGVSLVAAATFVAVVGDIGRFEPPKQLVGYVGLDAKLRRSGEQPARHGAISKQGSAAARHRLCEAAWIAVRTPGPLARLL